MKIERRPDKEQEELSPSVKPRLFQLIDTFARIYVLKK